MTPAHLSRSFCSHRTSADRLGYYFRYFHIVWLKVERIKGRKEVEGISAIWFMAFYRKKRLPAVALNGLYSQSDLKI